MTADLTVRNIDTAMHITRYICLSVSRMVMKCYLVQMLVVKCLDASDGLANDECCDIESARKGWLRCATLISHTRTVNVLRR